VALVRLLILLALTTSLQAQASQSVVSVPGAVGQFVPASQSSIRLDTEVEPKALSVVVSGGDYRWEGGVLGAFLVGALGYRYATATCNGDSGTGQSCLGHNLSRIAMGVLVGGVSGLFIGSSIPKHTSESAP
jgi:hypothetical protein